MTLPERFISQLLVYCFVLSAVAPTSAATKVSTTEHSSATAASTIVFDFLSTFWSLAVKQSEDENADEESGLRFRLSEAPEQPEAKPVSKVADTTALSEAETESILKRLPPIKTDPTDETTFALRDKSLPPPRTGITLLQPFPAANALAVPEPKSAGQLEVVRSSPEGEVPLAPNLSVTFSEPMVAVTSQEEAAQNVPVRLSPQPVGKWHWIGTRTLLFEPDGRFPMATQYSVTVPAGTKSANGATLAQPKSWTFATPPPVVKNFYPAKYSVQRRDVTMFAEFDQRIDPNTVLKHLQIEAGNRSVNFRLATAEEIEKDKDVRDLAKKAQADRWLAFRAVDANRNVLNALPAGATVTVSLIAGTPSAEGPRTTQKTETFPFMTFSPLKLVKSGCGYNYEQTCGPGTDWQVEFNNPIDPVVLKDSQVRVEPPLEDLKLSTYGNTLRIEGNQKPETTYRVTIDQSLTDKFEQTLGKDEAVEFKVGTAEPSIALSGEGFVVLDPSGPRQLSVYSVNYQTIKVSLYAVSPEDWVKFQVYIQLHYRGRTDEIAKNAKLPGRLVSSRQINLRQSRNEMVETQIDLTPALKDGLGQVIVVVDSIRPVNDIYHSPLFAWVQSTQIGLDAFVDNDELIGWASSLVDGAPLTNVQLQIKPSNVSGVTAADGLAHLPLKPVSGSDASILIARRGNDVAILPENANNWWETNGTWYHKPQTDELRWYVFDDRQIYRPGEEVHFKGWLRRIGAGKSGDVGPLNGAVNRIGWLLKDEQGNEVRKGELTPNQFGGFDSALKLSANMNLGHAQIEFKAQSTSKAFDNQEYVHGFQVQEFRRPEFEVSAKTDTEAPWFVGAPANVSVAAKYFAGGVLANAEVEWEVKSTPTNFTPPNRDDYTFGKWIPWWEVDSTDDYEENQRKEFKGRTDAGGKHRLRIDFDSVKPARPSIVTAAASVKDINRQTWSSTATMLVHPANLYVGLKSEKTFVQQGEPLVVQSIVTDLDGRSVANRETKMRAVLLDWKQVKGEWEEVEVSPQDCLIKSELDGVKCTFNPKTGGTYRVRATITDDQGRANESELTLWVAGGKQPPNKGVDEEDVKLIPDRKEYKAGETAQLLVQAPFYPAEAVMSLRRSGIIRTEHFRIESANYVLRVPVEEAWTPNVHVQVDIVGAEDREGYAGVPPAVRGGLGEAGGAPALPVKRPAYATGQIDLSIPPLSRRLNVVATPRDKALEPQGNTVIDIQTKDASGNAVSESEVAVVVVDESVLALTNYKLQDPISLFYSARESEVTDYRSRAGIVLGETLKGGGAGAGEGAPVAGIAATRSGVLAGRMMTETVSVSSVPTARATAMPLPTPAPGNNEDRQIRLRQNFNALAVFSPSVRTDKDGRAQVQVKLPDNLTRYRVMAVAVNGGKQFGSGEATITARLPLMARPSAPRFLNFGDQFELPIVLQNQTDSAMTVDVAVRATNASVGYAGVPPSAASETLAYRTGRRVTVPANDRVEVRVTAAAVKAGTARFQIGAVSGRWSDAAEVELPVWTPATTEAFATYGELDTGAFNQPVKAPANVFSQFGGLEIETSSTQLQALTDAVIYLTGYPFECSEQLASRVITIATLRDVLTAFKAKDLPSPAALEAAVNRDLKRLQGMQNSDGGFGFWQRGNESWPYLSIHVAHALARAKQKKFDVPGEMFEKSQKYLRDIESHIPARYSVETRRAIIAYALYVRAQMGDRDPSRGFTDSQSAARQLIADAKLENLSLESLGWLLSVLANDKNSVSEVTAIRHLLNNRVTETAGAAHFVCSYEDGDYLVLNSDRRADGVILEALIGDQPGNDLIPKLVRGLLAHRTRGRWANTQENVFILLALDRYFNTFEKVTPNFIARAWLGDRFAGEQAFKGRTTDRQQVNVPMRELVAPNSNQNLIISKEGAGRLYYRVGMSYAPSDLNLQPVDYGFTVERSYEAVDDRTDVSRDAGGTWHIKAGARVRVRLTMVAPARRYHVALVDPMAAGFEALNPSLATTGDIPRDEKQTGVSELGSRSFGFGWWWWRPEWFEHQNLRDDRAEAFTSLLWEGVYKYSYVARATTPGVFVVPPAKAEEMYQPETFGRGKTDRVRVE